MRAETRAGSAAAASACVLLSVLAPDSMLFLPAIHAELAERN